MRKRSARRTGSLITRSLATGTDMARLAETASALAVASGRTIGYRSAMLVKAMGNPVALADPEFHRMGHEKVQAGTEAAHAVAASFGPLHEAWAAWMVAQARMAQALFAGLDWTVPPAERWRRQSRAMERGWAAATVAAVRLGEAAVRTAGAGLKPIHTVASANAERLAKAR
jgi:hypothetical protein